MPENERFYALVVDGPNFVSRLIERGLVDKFLEGKASLSGLNGSLRARLGPDLGCGRCLGVDFFCSDKQIGPKGHKLDADQTASLLSTLSKEHLVTVHKVILPGNKEKGVDVVVASKLFEMTDYCETLVLLASDKDYVPALQTVKRKGKFIVTLGFRDKHPEELINLSHQFYDLNEMYFDGLGSRVMKAGGKRRTANGLSGLGV